MDGPTGKRRLKTLDTAADIIEVLQHRGGAGVKEVANELNLPPSTVHGYLSTMDRNRYLTKEDDKYHVGLKLLNVGGFASVRKPGYKYARMKVKQVARESGEGAQFIAEEHGRGYYISTDTEDPDVQIDARIGKEVYLHASSAGKAILAHLPERRQEAIIEQWGLPQLTENTITDPDRLFDELSEVRRRGYSYNLEETVLGLHAVGVPVRTTEGNILGGLSVAGPSSRLKGDALDSEIPDLLLRTANEIELSILSPGPR